MSGDVRVMSGDVGAVSSAVMSMGAVGEVLSVCLDDMGCGAGVGGA